MANAIINVLIHLTSTTAPRGMAVVATSCRAALTVGVSPNDGSSTPGVHFATSMSAPWRKNRKIQELHLKQTLFEWTQVRPIYAGIGSHLTVGARCPLTGKCPAQGCGSREWRWEAHCAARKTRSCSLRSENLARLGHEKNCRPPITSVQTMKERVVLVLVPTAPKHHYANIKERNL